MVISPHPDDETLGCGGTILRKLETGAHVSVVYMTRGERSHTRFVSPAKMGIIRQREAIQACKSIGIPESDVHFLPFQSAGTWKGTGSLEKGKEEAEREILSKLDDSEPRHIFMPYPGGEHPDHIATNHIVRRVLESHGISKAFEYPVWFWNHWPWVGFNWDPDRVLGFIRKSISASIKFWTDFSCSIYVGDLLERKRQALENHVSQMMPHEENPGWKTLGAISRGEFLDALFQKYEVFREWP